MKYDTTPLSIDTAGVDLNPPEDELRFVPDDTGMASAGELRSGEISQSTIIAPSFGFDTFIEGRPQAKKLDDIKEKLGLPKYRSWALTGLLASVSAFGGGFAVYWVSSERSVPAVSRPPAPTLAPVTEIQDPETFVSRQAAAAAEEPLIPQGPGITQRKDRSITLPASRAVDPTILDPEVVTSSEDHLVNPSSNVVEQPKPPQPERESKVGSYVVEKPAGRNPLARCADGTYSYSASRSAACAGRGGVGEWIGQGKPAPATPAKQAAYVLGPRGGCYYLDSSSKKIYVEKKYCQQ